jgi:hypothetical protein
MKITRENLGEHLIEYQLGMVGKTMEDAKKDTQWFHNITITKAQHEEYMKYAIPLIKKVLKCNTSKAKKTFAWFDLEFGLRVVLTKKDHNEILKDLG